MNIVVEDFGKVGNETVQLFTLENDNGVTIKLTNYGGIITSIITPDKNDKAKNVVLGFDKLETYLSEQYLNSYPYFGCIIGRVGNRISNSQFKLNEKLYKLSANHGENQLHGGLEGFDKKIWQARNFENEDEIGVDLSYLSVDGEEGFPGDLSVLVRYTLNNENELGMEYFAETDKATPVNLTQHTYFNLGEETTIHNHKLQVLCEKYTELNADSIPTGNLNSVEQSVYDLRQLKRIGNGFSELEMGYDINYCFDNANGSLKKIAELVDEVSGRKIEVSTTQIGMQVYTGAYNPEIEIDGEKKFGKFSGVALETQGFPDAVNQPKFPSIILNPVKKYHQKTIYRFSTINKA